MDPTSEAVFMNDYHAVNENERTLRSIKTGPLPRINVQEPTSSSNANARNHIAQNLMRNPRNSLIKLQRQNTLPTDSEPKNIFLVPPEQRRYLTPQSDEEEQIPAARDILNSRNADGQGFKTVALLKRASMIGMRFQSIREGDTVNTSSNTSGSQVSFVSTPLRPIDVFPIFVTSTSSSMLNSCSTSSSLRKKPAVDRVREIVRILKTPPMSHAGD
uniref:Uncharacterized protein n=2 Tax=Caenorhabditis japonica TaxID=281687 RepID=A0A8R1I3K3_CAEJA